MQARGLDDCIEERFGQGAGGARGLDDHAGLIAMAGRASCRAFRADMPEGALLETLAAVALSAPTKSDLQQRDIVIIDEPETRAALAGLVAGQGWVAEAPCLVVFCANNRRQRALHDWTGLPFANDHLDAFFNATVDAAIALGAFVTAAEAVGLGTCPISAVRNEGRAVSDLLGLPDHVFAVAGLAVGYPAAQAPISKRLPLNLTVHRNRYCEDGLRPALVAYARERAVSQPYHTQRQVEAFGHNPDYDWITEKTRHYSRSERADFGEFIRNKGFCLD